MKPSLYPFALLIASTLAFAPTHADDQATAAAATTKKATDENQDTEVEEYVGSTSIVMYHEDDAEKLKPLAEELSKQFNRGVKGIVQASPRNPVCCVWLELVGKPNPGDEGYVILHQAGGTVIQASSVESIKAALKRWHAASKEDPYNRDRRTYPVGLMTSYKVVESKKDK